MNRTELRTEVSRWAEEAVTKGEFERPSAADIEALQRLWELRKTPSILSSSVSSNIAVMHSDDPDWHSWPSIAAHFKAYYSALVEVDNKGSSPLANGRLGGV
jgi:hypothetical protein